MADIFDQLQPETQNKGDIFDQISTPVGHPTFTPQQFLQNNPTTNAQYQAWRSAHPYLSAIEDTGNQVLVNPPVQAINAVTPAINGLNKLMGPSADQIPQIQGPDMTNAPPVAKFLGGLGNIAGGVAEGGAAAVASGGNPIGFIPAMAAISGLGAYGKGQPVVPAAIQGAAGAVIPTVAGYGGSALAKAAAKPIANALSESAPEVSQAISKFAPRFGTASGMGTAGGIMGGAQGAATGAAFGALAPAGEVKQVPQDEYENKIIPSAAKTYMQILNPGKGYTKNIELKQGGDVNDASETLVKNGIILRKGDDGKLDNTQPIQQLNGMLDPLRDQQNQLLASNKSSQFDLQAIGQQAKNSEALKNQFKNDLDYNKAKNVIDDEINAAIQNHGRYVSGEQLNNMKTGWWKVGYDQNNLVRQPVARQLGNISKNAIEQAYPNGNITSINDQMGKLLSARDLLENTHGNAVVGGRIGKYFANTVGGVAGTAVGHSFPGLGEIAGPVVGWKVGGKINDVLNDPTRITTNIQNGLKNIKVINPEVQGEYIPPQSKASVSQAPIDVQAQGPTQVGFNPRFGIPSNIPLQGSSLDRGQMGIGKKFTPNIVAGQAQRPTPENQYWQTKFGGENDPYGFLAESKKKFGK